MKRTYEVRDRADKRAIREFLKREGQFLLPMLELVEQTEVAIDEVIQVMGRATIEAVLEMSAEGVAGVKQAGRSRAEDDTVWYGRQGGVVYLSDRKVRVERPRLRRRGAGEGGEVEVPAYAAMRRPGAVADRMLEVLMAGVSTRKYGRVIGEMADTVGVSKSAVSRETVEASERVLKELMERRLDAWDLLVIYLDGIQMGSHHVLAAVGVDSDGKKHVLGVREGASENAEVTSALLEDLVERGLDPGRRRLFVIDGSKALRKAIEKVFGQRHPIQRCRNHKLRNVLGHLPKDQHPQVKAAFRAAMKLDAKQGEQKLEQLARWLERDHPSASASLREGLSEMFTINRLGLPPRLRKCPTAAARLGILEGEALTHHVRDESISTPSKVLCAETSTNTFTPLTSSTSSTGVDHRGAVFRNSSNFFDGRGWAGRCATDTAVLGEAHPPSGN